MKIERGEGPEGSEGRRYGPRGVPPPERPAGEGGEQAAHRAVSSGRFERDGGAGGQAFEGEGAQSEQGPQGESDQAAEQGA